MDDRRSYDLLMGLTCPACGSDKHTAHSFCKDCYFHLPEQMRMDLYKRIGAGYTQAFNRALGWLREHIG
jgi:uncharacterized OB-fold protein